MDAIVSGPGEGEPLREDDRTILVKAVQPQLDVLEFDVAARYGGPGPHFHERHVDSFYVLDGWLELFVDGEPVVAGAGTYVLVRPGAVHSFTSDGPARFLNVHAPDTGFVEYMRALDRGESVDPARFDVHEAEGPVAAVPPVVSPRHGGERLERRYGSLVVKAAAAPVSVFELVIERPWDGVAPHTHDDHLDAFYVLEGAVEFLLGDETVPAGAGTLVASPPGVTHGIAPTTEPARLLNLHAPDAGYAASVRR